MARDPADVNVVLLEENTPQAVILWKRINAYDAQYRSLGHWPKRSWRWPAR